MRLPEVWPRAAARVAVAATLVATAAACTFDRQPNDVEPTVPWSGELRYGPVGDDFCDHIPWEAIASEVGMTVDGAPPEANDDTDGRPEDTSEPDTRRTESRATCEYNMKADYLDERWGTFAGLYLLTLEGPERAHNNYRSLVNTTTERYYDPTVGPTEGWWSEGTLLESVRRERDGVYVGVVHHHVYHENLYLGVSVIGHLTDVEEAVASFHKLVNALTDEVKVYLPCRTLNGQPTAHCD